MAEEFFNTLRNRGTEIDEQIKKLSDIWRHPSNILGGYGADSKQAETYITFLRNEISALKESLDNENISRKNYMDEIERYSEESKRIYEDLEQQCNDVRTVLSEYGYVRPEDENLENKLESVESNGNCSLISSDVTDDLLEVEFTPDMTWRHKAKTVVS